MSLYVYKSECIRVIRWFDNEINVVKRKKYILYIQHYLSHGRHKIAILFCKFKIFKFWNMLGKYLVELCQHSNLCLIQWQCYITICPHARKYQPEITNVCLWYVSVDKHSCSIWKRWNIFKLKMRINKKDIKKLFPKQSPFITPLPTSS